MQNLVVLVQIYTSFETRSLQIPSNAQHSNFGRFFREWTCSWTFRLFSYSFKSANFTLFPMLSY